MHGNKAIVHAHFSYVMTPAEGFNFVIETKHPMACGLVFMIPMNLKSCKK